MVKRSERLEKYKAGVDRQERRLEKLTAVKIPM